jgi:hypothetical protein
MFGRGGLNGLVVGLVVGLRMLENGSVVDGYSMK